MDTHRADANVQEAACRAFSKQIQCNPTICELVGEESSYLLPMHTSVLAALNIHIDDVYVFHAACSAIHSMACHSKLLQQYLVAKGAFIPIVDRMRANSTESEVQEWGCRALRALSMDHPIQKHLLFKYDILSQLIVIMSTWSDKVSVLEECVGLLASLATDLEEVRRQCTNNETLSMILKLMNIECPTNDLIEMTLEALGKSIF